MINTKCPKWLLTLAVFMLCQLYYSQNHPHHTTVEKMIGKWSLDLERSLPSSTSASLLFNRLDSQKKKKINETFESRSVKFGKDGSYEVEIGNGSIVTGKWELLGDGKTIHIYLDNSPIPIVQELLMCNEQSMDIGFYGNNKDMVFDHWVLNRISK